MIPVALRAALGLLGSNPAPLHGKEGVGGLGGCLGRFGLGELGVAAVRNALGWVLGLGGLGWLGGIDTSNGKDHGEKEKDWGGDKGEKNPVDFGLCHLQILKCQF